MIALVFRPGLKTAGDVKISDDPVVDVFVNVDKFQADRFTSRFLKAQRIQVGCYGTTVHHKEEVLPPTGVYRMELFDDSLAREVVERIGEISDRRRQIVSVLLDAHLRRGNV
jgi:hypothetical protein